MIWRPFCSSCLHTIWNVPKTQAASQHRYIIGRRFLGISKPNVSTILATLPSTDKLESQQITLTGFVRTIRNQKLRSFVEVGDGSTIYTLQAVLDPQQAKGLATGASIRITGTWQPAPPDKEQKYELRAHEVEIIGSSDAEIYPIQKKYHSAEYLRSIPHLRLRIPLNALLARIRSECHYYLSTFFHNLEFVQIQPPLITSSDCEGAGEVFTVSSEPILSSSVDSGSPPKHQKVHFFREPKFLTVSSQLHLEAFVHEHQKVWCMSPAFRAEKSETPRHLSEFWMLEAEFQTESLEDVMDLAENMIRSLTSHLSKSKFTDEIISIKHTRQSESTALSTVSSDLVFKRWEGLLRNKWPRITYNEAIQRLRGAADQKQVIFQHEPSWHNGLQFEHEKFIATEVGKGSPVFVTDYPQEIKPFYMHPSKRNSACDSQTTAACFDLLLPDVCEIIGGSLREHRLEHLTNSMQKDGLMKARGAEISMTEGGEKKPLLGKAGNLDWYLDLRRFGSVPHGGFGLGLDRLISYLVDVHNIKDVAPWPRWYSRCDC